MHPDWHVAEPVEHALHTWADVLRHMSVGGRSGTTHAVQVIPFIVGEAQCPGERTEQLWRRVPRPALLEPHEIFDADARERRELLAAKAGRASPRSGRQPYLLRAEPVAPGPQHCGELVHGYRMPRRAASDLVPAGHTHANASRRRVEA